MIIKKVKLENFTVFETQNIEFCPGINVIIGENGTGKTHLLKLLYSACQSVDEKVSFPQKIVSTLLPDNYRIARLVNRKHSGGMTSIKVTAGDPDKILSASFSTKTKKWESAVTGEDGWESAFAGVSSIFIPAKEILSHSYNLNAAAERNNVQFDDTYLDVINTAKIDISKGCKCDAEEAMLKTIETITHGSVLYDVARDEFYLKRGNTKQEFALIAEGIRKMALLWQLVKNGALKKGDILFWDEPEANINPGIISVIVDLLLTLQRNGVQIFISTHDYLLASYFEVKKTPDDSLLYHSLSFSEKDVLQYCQNRKFGDIENNSIINSFNLLLNQIYNMEI